jgi:Polymerase beta, Nucleotidyltransferase
MSPIVCLLLYGSRARGDHDVHSDIDLTVITAGDTAEPVTVARITTMAYPLDDALRAARSGSLFAFHLVSEGKVLFESAPVFGRIQRAFQFRDDYTPVIRMCAEAGWFLLHHREKATDARKFNQAVAWCTREMLIARAAAERSPVFSADGLAKFVGCSAVAPVIRSKRSAVINPAILREFRGILGQFGAPEPTTHPILSSAERGFRASRNSAGVIAMHAFRDQAAGADVEGGQHVPAR